MEIYKNVPKLSTIEKIANALEVEPQILFQNTQLPPDKEKDIAEIKQSVMKSVMETLEKELDKSLRRSLDY